jgi:hypothetical protein
MIAKVRNTEMIPTKVPISPVDIGPSIKAARTLTGGERRSPEVNQPGVLM